MREERERERGERERERERGGGYGCFCKEGGERGDGCFYGNVQREDERKGDEDDFGPDCYRRTGDTYKNNRTVFISLARANKTVEQAQPRRPGRTTRRFDRMIWSGK